MASSPIRRGLVCSWCLRKPHALNCPVRGRVVAEQQRDATARAVANALQRARRNDAGRLVLTPRDEAALRTALATAPEARDGRS